VALLEPLAAASSEGAELHGALADAYLALRRYAEAEAAYDVCLRARGHDPARWCGLGDAAGAQGKTQLAEECYRKALALAPDYGQGHSRLGLLYARQRRFKRAYEHFARYLELRPNSPNAMSNTANVLIPLGRPQDAVRLLRTALERDPAYPPAHEALWRGLLGIGRPAEAIDALRKATRALPDRPALARELAWLLATSPDSRLRNGAEALTLAERCCTGPHADARSLDVLAAACAEAGQFDRAVESARRAAGLAGEGGQTALQQQITARLSLYEAGLPYRAGRTP
jgi:tetratricopeptide (TPR) repeat protein